MTEEHAWARRTDPGTSWAAARSLDPTALRTSQRYVLALLQDYGPMTDERLVDLAAGVLSPSGARTRRSELVAKGLAYDTGKRLLTLAHRQTIVWAARWVSPTPLSLWDNL